jgi:hypothetical protein
MPWQVSPPLKLLRLLDISRKDVVVFVNLDSTHNFINKKGRISQLFYITSAKFQVIVENRGTLSCGEKCHNNKLSMGDYNLSIPMY